MFQCTAFDNMSLKFRNHIIRKTFYKLIEQKGMTFDHDFSYSFPHFSSLLKNREEKRRIKQKNPNQKACLSARSYNFQCIFKRISLQNIWICRVKFYGSESLFESFYVAAEAINKLYDTFYFHRQAKFIFFYCFLKY